MFGNKSGRGISKEDAAKRNYFDIFSRHLGHICGASFWFALTNALFFGASAYLFISYFSGENSAKIITAFLTGQTFILPIVPFLPLMFTGPFTAGFTYVIRNYAKQEHTFLISDFFEHSKKNFKQAIITSILTYSVMYLILQALIFYNSLFVTHNLPLGTLYTIVAVVLFLFITMSFYIYPIIVTFKMDYKTIIKNSWIFTIIKLPQNFIIFAFLTAIHATLIYITFYVLMLPEIWIILMIFFLTGFTSFTANYYIWHVLDKHIVRLVTPKKTESIFRDEEHTDFDSTEENENNEF